MAETTKYIILLIAAASVTLLLGCRRNNSDRKIVIVSIEPQRWILEKIVGDKIQVISFLNGNSDPENFDPPLSTIKSASKSLSYFKTGFLPWEDMIVERIKGGNDGMKMVTVANGIKPVTGTHGHGHSDEVDPHIWTSVKNAKIIAKNMFDAITELDSMNSSYYKENFDKLINELNSLDSAFESIKNQNSKNIIVYHPILSYLARDYNFNQIVIGSENKEFSISNLKDKLQEIDDNPYSIAFYQPNGELGQLNALLGKTDIRMIEINPMNYDWDIEMNKILEALTSVQE